ncbi:MAG: hypothetical protein ACYC54_13560 [Sedimentisphaerales bacterium]
MRTTLLCRFTPRVFEKNIRKVFALSHSFGNWIQTKIFYHPRTKTLSLFYAHRIEHTPVRINTNKKLMFGLETPQRLKCFN